MIYSDNMSIPRNIEAVREAEANMLSSFGVFGPDYRNLTPKYFQEHSILDPVREFAPGVGRLCQKSDTPWPLRIIEMNHHPIEKTIMARSVAVADVEEEVRLIVETTEKAGFHIREPRTETLQPLREILWEQLCRRHIIVEIDPQAQADTDDVDQLLSKLADAGLHNPGGPYVEEGRLQMRDALRRLSLLLKQHNEANTEEDQKL